MSIHVAWYDADKTIILWKFSDDWDWRDYHAAINAAVVMIKSVDHIVDSIMDLQNNRSLPPNALMQGKRWFVVAPPNFGITVIAGGSGLVRGIASTIASLYKRFSDRILMTATVDEAVQIILDKKRQRRENPRQ